MNSVITERFQTLVDSLIEACSKHADGIKNVDQLGWMLCNIINEANPTDRINTLCDRTEAESLYEADDNTRQDKALAKVQSDLLSAIAREYTARHKSRIRRFAHAAVVRKHAGSEQGVFISNLMQYIQNQIKRAQSVDGND